MSLPLSGNSARDRLTDLVEKAGDTKSEEDLRRGRQTAPLKQTSGTSQTRDTKSNADLTRGKPRAASGKKKPPSSRTFDESKHRRKGGGWGGKKVKGAGQFTSTMSGGGQSGKAAYSFEGRKDVKTNAEAGNPRKGQKYIEMPDPKGRGKLHVYESGQKFLVRDKKKVQKTHGGEKRGGPIEHLIAHYMKMPHPFTACVRDNRKRFGGRTEAVCAGLKDLALGTHKWRAQFKGKPGYVAKADGEEFFDGPIEELSFEDANAMLEHLADEGLLENDYGYDMVAKSFYEEPYYEDEEDDEPEMEYGVYKSSDEKMRTTGVLYLPDTVDAHDEFVVAEELEDAVVDYVRKSNFQIRHQHRDGTVMGEIVGVISWPYETEVELLMPEPVGKSQTTGDFGGVGCAPLTVAQGGMRKTKRKLPPGTVYATVQWTKAAWPLVKSGQIGGFSMGGRGVRVRGASPAEQGKKPEMQGSAGVGVGEAGAGHLAGPRPAGARAAGAAYDGMGQIKKGLPLVGEGALLKRALHEPDDEDEFEDDVMPHVIEDDEDEPVDEDEIAEAHDMNTWDTLSAMAAMGNRAAQRAIRSMTDGAA